MTGRIRLIRQCSAQTWTRHVVPLNTLHQHNSQIFMRYMSTSQSLPKTMKAQVLTKLHPKDFQIGMEELKMPVPGNGECLIKVRAAGVCHTDLHVMKDEVKFPIPAVMGHEISGTVVSIGPNQDPVKSKTLRVGQRIVSPFIMPCGGCYQCVRGREDICDTFFDYNRLKGQLYDGTTRLYRLDNTPVAMYSMAGLAEYCVVPSTAVFELPESIPFSEASIIGCAIFTAYGAVRHGTDLRGGESVAVIGAGGVGANVLQFARAFGASRVIAIDVSDDKLKAMAALGATHTINGLKESVADKIKEYTNGRGADVVIEALGRRDTFVQAVGSVSDGGRAVIVGIAPAGVTADIEITRIVRRSIRIIGSYGAKARQDIPAILSMIQKGLIDVSSPITKRYNFTEAEQAYKDLNAGKITGRAIVQMEQ